MPSTRIHFFDTWRPGYGLAQVRVVVAGTDNDAEIFTDEDLTAEADNPQTLAQRIDGQISYGKFLVPLYIGVPYELVINSIDRTGVERPAITTLAGVDASEAVATVAGGNQDFALEDHLARRIDVRDFGEWKAVGEPGASASTNNATLTAALGIAGGDTGGFVEIPDGTYQITASTLPVGTVVRGRGRAATTLLSTQAGNVFTIGGARAGFCRLTLDGSTLVGGSVGISAVNKDEIVLDDVEVKRFETGIYRKGGTRAAWREVYISNCVTGYKAHGDLASALGAALRFNTWRGGKVELCTTAGIDLRYIDAACEHNLFDSIVFDTNTGKAVWAIGVRGHSLLNCRWSGNTNNLTLSDASPVTSANTVTGFNLIGGQMSGGTVTLEDTLEQVAFRRMELSNITVTLTSPGNNVLIEDCRESGIAIAGDTTAWRRHQTFNRNSSFLVTISNVPTKGWAMSIEPGQHVYLESKVIGRRVNGTDFNYHHNAVAARRPGSTLAYEIQTGQFHVGTGITGATSGATGLVVADNDAGATGTLTLYNIVGVFEDGEIITDSAGGSATVNGTLTHKRAQILTPATLAYDAQIANFTVGQIVTGVSSGAKARITADNDGGTTGTLTLTDIEGAFIDNEAITDGAGGNALVNGELAFSDAIRPSVDGAVPQWSNTFIANDAEIELRVKGDTGHSVEWTVDVDVVSN